MILIKEFCFDKNVRFDFSDLNPPQNVTIILKSAVIHGNHILGKNKNNQDNQFLIQFCKKPFHFLGRNRGGKREWTGMSKRWCFILFWQFMWYSWWKQIQLYSLIHICCLICTTNGCCGPILTRVPMDGGWIGTSSDSEIYPGFTT